MDDWQEFVLQAEAYLALAVVGAMVLAAWWWLVPESRGQRLHLPRIRRISWKGIDVFTAFILLAMIPSLVDETLKKAGLFDSLYPDVDDKSMRGRSLLWSSTLAPPLIIGLIVLGLQQLRGTRPVELGLTNAGAAVNVRLGYITWLLLTPLVYAVLFGADWLIKSAGGTIDEHPVSEVTKQSLMPVEWLLMFAGTVVLMPLLEELLFRGLMLPWQLRGGWEAQATTMFCALFFAALGGALANTYNPDPLLFVVAMLPLLFVLPYVQLRRAPRASAAPGETPSEVGGAGRGLLDVLRCAGDRRAQPTLAVFTNGLFFAALHSSVWPSPVPLFVLGMGLAWLRYRTSSLVGSLTLHALFNAVTFLALAGQNVQDYWK